MRSLLILWLACTALPALSQQATPPSDESLRQLFEATHVTRILDTYMSTLDSGMQAGMRAALQGATPNATQQQIIADMRAQIVKEFRATLSWPKLEPIYMDIYRRNFTQQQVNDILAFYRTPSGRAMVEKMPAVMQQASQAVQGMLPDLMQHMKQIQSDGIARLRAAGNDN
jgi:uncharacterized protein